MNSNIDYAKRRKTNKKILSVFGAIIVIVIIAAIAGGGSSNNVSTSAVTKPVATKTAATTYKVDYDPTTSVFVVNPSTVTVSGTVTNTGAATGTPSCDIQVKDPSGTYSGFDSFSLKPLAAGAQEGFHGQITVTSQGAQYVSVTRFSCQ